MANPTKYTKGYGYTGFQQSRGNDSFPGTHIDDDLRGVEESIDEIVDALGDVRRSDGALNNGIVTQESMSSDALAEFTAEADRAETAADSAEAFRDSAEGHKNTASAAASAAEGFRDTAEEHKDAAEAALETLQTVPTADPDTFQSGDKILLLRGGILVNIPFEGLPGPVTYDGDGLLENTLPGVAFGGAFVLSNYSGDAEPTFSAVDPTGRVSTQSDGTAIAGLTAADYENSQLAQPVVTATITLDDQIIAVSSTIDVLILNQANTEEVPFNLRLNNTVIQSGSAAGAIVGTFSAEHLNIGETLVFSLTGNGADDSRFTVFGSQLLTDEALVEGDYAIEWRATDEFGNEVEKSETISVSDHWYLLGDVVDGWAIDPAQGDGVGYTLSAGVVSAIHDVLGSAEDLLPVGAGAAIGEINGVDAPIFDGATATVKKYIGAASAAAATLDGSVPFKNISVHSAFHTASIATTQTALALTNAAGTATPEYRLATHTNGLSLELIGSGLTTMTIGTAAAAAPGNYDNVDWVTGCFNDGVLTTAWSGGDLSQFELSQAFLKLAGDLNFDRIAIGGVRAELEPFNGRIGGQAIIADADHTLAGAVAKHRGLIRAYAAPRMLDVALWIFYGQSNSLVDNIPLIGANIPDYTAYQWRAGTLLYDRTNVGPAMGRTCPGIHMGKHFQELTGITPFFFQHARSGTPVTPQASVAQATGGNTFIGVQSALSDSLGRVSWYSTDSTAGRHDYLMKMKRMFNAVPRFNIKHIFVLFIGAESDGLAATDGDVTTAEFRTEMDLLFDQFNTDLGQCTFLVCPLGARGATLGEVQAEEVGNAAIRNEQRDQCLDRADTFNVFDHAAAFDPLNFSTNDLVVDGNGYWVSGRRMQDEIHYHEDFSICIGKTGAYNAAVQLGYVSGSVI